jgi:hypothetical protein
MADTQQPENVEHCNYLGGIITNGARCSREIKSRIIMSKAALNKKKLFTSKLDVNLKNKLVKCCIWSTAVYGAEIWTYRKVDQIYLEV